VGASHVSLAVFDPGLVLDLIGRHQVTHLCGAPVVLNEIANRARAFGRFDHPVLFATGGAPPAPTTIAAMRGLGIGVTHLYGLTETYGPSIICEVQPHWSDLDQQSLAQAISRQGVRTINVESVRVVDNTFADVPRDGESIGEIVIRSNTVVPRYHGDPERSSEVIRGGWLFTGDLAVMHPDGYLEVRDRSKDIIISGGENVSSIEVENILLSHPAVSEAAVVASPHPTWGEVPVAFVTLRSDQEASEADLIEYVRTHLAHFKAPKAVVFTPLPKTSTGKVQKYELRARARSLMAP
jgi:fatty-acyl-CoA synthase